MAKTEEEASQGVALGTPVPLTRDHMERYNASRRMAMEEFREHEVSAENPLGKRLRLVDDLSESMVNFATGCTRAVRNDGVDFFRFVVLLTNGIGHEVQHVESGCEVGFRDRCLQIGGLRICSIGHEGEGSGGVCKHDSHVFRWRVKRVWLAQNCIVLGPCGQR